MPSSDVPDIVVGRLPIYLRALAHMAASGQEITSSHELGQKLGISSAQIRKDLSHFGEFGKQGTGYRISHLQDQIKRILHVDREWEVALVGIGDLGHAVARYNGFKNRGFHISLLFDNDPAKIGTQIGALEILDSAQLKDKLIERQIKIVMIAVPASAAQAVTDICVEAGVRAILNYAPISLAIPEGVRVQHLDPVAYLQRMTYYL
ncbi:MAG TPA: redox-sensing transcriptional repressor Rex [Anaerolineae bacterium]|nr:redox-sensing transcriptional repressor Rex [Anaerolineae bacterium]